MNNPPTPILPSDWHTTVAALTWIAVTGSFGRFQTSGGTPVYMAHVFVGYGACQWMASTTAPSNGVQEALISANAANILKGGTVNTDGTLSYLGNNYAVQAFWTGFHFEAFPAVIVT